MPAEKSWPAFDCKTWLQGQISLLLHAEMVTVAEARAAVESLADDDRFWGLVEPLTRAAIQTLERDPSLDSILTEHDAKERHKRGLA